MLRRAGAGIYLQGGGVEGSGLRLVGGGLYRIRSPGRVVFLFEVYDNCNNWSVSPDICLLVRDVNLEPHLGSTENVNEAPRIITVIDNTWFDSLPERWRNSGGYDCGSIGRSAAGAD